MPADPLESKILERWPYSPATLTIVRSTGMPSAQVTSLLALTWN